MAGKKYDYVNMTDAEIDSLPVSRQRKWQMRQKRDGFCATCGKPRTTYSVHCDECYTEKVARGYGIRNPNFAVRKQKIQEIHKSLSCVGASVYLKREELPFHPNYIRALAKKVGRKYGVHPGPYKIFVVRKE